MRSHRFPATNWAGNVIFEAARTFRPESVDSLRRVVENSRRIRALGSGHSFSGIADTDHDLISLTGLPRVLTIDSTNSTVTVDSGTTYTELARELHAAGFALANTASISPISIAGACATGTHGSGNGQRVLAASVAALQLVGSGGELVDIRRDVDGERFCGSVVALGALGIVTLLTLDVEPTYDMSQRVHVGVPLDEIQGNFDEVSGAGYSVSVFTDWQSDEASVWIKRRVGEPVSTWDAGRQARHSVHPIPGLSPALCTEQLGVVGPWLERLPHFHPEATSEAGHELQSEVFLPRDCAEQAIRSLREIGELFAPALLVCEIRTGRADDLWLSPAYGRDSLAIHCTWTSDAAVVRPAVAALEERLLPLDPRPHWGKITTMQPLTVIESYECAGDFERLMLELDPTFKFRNGFVNSLFPLR
jgi:alditol oxidase